MHELKFETACAITGTDPEIVQEAAKQRVFTQARKVIRRQLRREKLRAAGVRIFPWRVEVKRRDTTRVTGLARAR